MTDLKQTDPQQRLRPAPSERFAGQSHVFDLPEVLKKLRAEAHPAQDGHRQITILRQPPVAQIVFAFDEGGVMADHVAHGLVTIHVLEGNIVVHAEGADHDLKAGHVLVLNPDVRHDVRAPIASAMLLTVHLKQAH